MNQLLGLLSYRGRFHPTKSCRTWPSDQVQRGPAGCARPATWNSLSHPVPFLFCWATREGLSHQMQVETLSPVGGFNPGSSEGSEVGRSLSVTSIPSGGRQNDMPAMTRIPAASENSSATRNRVGGDNVSIRRKALAIVMRNEPINKFCYRGTHLALTSEHLHGSQAFKSRINKNLFLSSVLGSRRNSWLVCLLKYYWHTILQFSNNQTLINFGHVNKILTRIIFKPI